MRQASERRKRRGLENKRDLALVPWISKTATQKRLAPALVLENTACRGVAPKSPQLNCIEGWVSRRVTKHVLFVSQWCVIGPTKSPTRTNFKLW